MVELRYPLASLAFDYLRGIVGLGIAVIVMSSLDADTAVFWVVAGLAGLFLFWTIHTALRHVGRLRFDEQGLRSEPWPRKYIAWDKLEEIGLRYYSVRRKRKDGWMTLTLRADQDKIEIESSLPHFAAIAARAAAAAKERGLTPDQITVENLAALGVKGEL